MRLNKYIAAAGICSRRKADELIANGNVKVNGAVVQQMGVDVGEDDVVMVNGKVLEHRAQKKVYVAVNKPLGYITSMDDDKGRGGRAGGGYSGAAVSGGTFRLQYDGASHYDQRRRTHLYTDTPEA